MNNKLNHQKIIEKPWGKEVIWGDIVDKCLGKILYISPNNRLSRQYHAEKEEVIYVISGTLVLEIGQEPTGEPKKTIYMSPEDSYHIHPGVIHRFCATSDEVILAEISTYFPKDVVRLQDDYSRN